MRAILTVLVLGFATMVVGQSNNENPVSKNVTNSYLNKRASDHFMIQYGFASLAGKPDSIATKGFSRSFNMYLMYDFPSKTNKHLSVAVGPGIGTDNFFFSKTSIDINDRKNAIFRKDSTTSYKKYKLATAYLELPVELRYNTNAENSSKGWKFALGAKLGMNIDAHTKAKVSLDPNKEGNYTMKVKNTFLFNGTRLALTGRVGIGAFSLFGTYSFSGMFRESYGPSMRPYSIGLCLSGL
jgi:Outer membrane protein beta-barrel domain